MTTGISLVRENAAAMHPPRMLWVSFPLGRPLGRAGDAAFQHRVGKGLSDVVRRHAGGVLVIACHGGVVDAAFRYLLRLPQVGGFELHTVNTSITEFVEVRSARWRLARYNDAGHLAGLPKETARETG